MAQTDQAKRTTANSTETDRSNGVGEAFHAHKHIQGKQGKPTKDCPEDKDAS